MITDTLKQTIQSALNELNIQATQDIHLEHPNDESHGDWSTNIALALFAQHKQDYSSPRDLAQVIVDQLATDPHKMVKNISVAGPGFINWHLDPSVFISELSTINSLKDRYGTQPKNHKTVIVEYSSPNIAKPFTIGHLRSTVIGDALSNLLELAGWDVLRDNHLGDWGTQFGKQIYAIKHLGEGSEQKNIEMISQSKNPVKELVKLYVEFHKLAEDQPEIEDEAREWFSKLENNDPEAQKLWQLCIDWSWQEFSKIYTLLNVKDFYQGFDNGKGLGESFFVDKIDPVIDQLEKKDLLKEGEDGAMLIFFEDDKYPPAMILKKDGTTLYHTRDLAADYFRKIHVQPDLIINEVGSEQSLYFKQLFEIENLLGWYSKDQRLHISHGLFVFKDGKMSTRKGKVIWLRDVINQAIAKALELQSGSANKELAQAVAIGALKYNDLKGSPERNITFDWDEVLNMQGNSGPYLQYAHARAISVIKKSREDETVSQLDGIEYQPNQEELALLRWLSRYKETVADAAVAYAPHQISSYIYQLAQRFNQFYNKHSILGTNKQPIDENQRVLRLAITSATATILKNGLAILGIDAPEKM